MLIDIVKVIKILSNPFQLLTFSYFKQELLLSTDRVKQELLLSS